MLTTSQTSGPYRPTTWSLGGRNSKKVDVPITSVFLVLYIIGAVIHMTIFQLNRRKGHKFLFNAVLFGFCMARTTTTILRIASTELPTNINLAIAAAVFVAAATILIFIINLIWAQRVLRSLHPQIGWNPMISLIFKLLYGMIVLTLVISITGVVQQNFTLRPRTRTIDRALLLYGQTFTGVFSLLPIFVTLLALAIPRRSTPDSFGTGKMSTKIAILLAGSTIMSIGAWYRCGTSWQTPVPMSKPLPSYFHKACFYVFNFTIEVIVIYLYAFMRVDQRFWIPNGAKGPGSYEAGKHAKGEMEESKNLEQVESV